MNYTGDGNTPPQNESLSTEILVPDMRKHLLSFGQGTASDSQNNVSYHHFFGYLPGLDNQTLFLKTLHCLDTGLGGFHIYLTQNPPT